jgi:hypothetical protein
LTGIGIAGMITSTVLAVKATPKALKCIEEKKEELGLVEEDNLTVKETVQAAWKPYIPATVTTVASVACLIGSTSISTRRNAALTAAYQLSTTALKEYREKVVETIGEKKEKTIHDKIAEEKVKEKPAAQHDVIFTGNGKTRCYDILSGRTFESDRNKIDRAINELNYRMTGGMEMYVSLNEFYDRIGIPGIPVGDDIGWRVDKGLIEIHYSSFLLDDDEPVMTIEFLIPPEHGFNKLY